MRNLLILVILSTSLFLFSQCDSVPTAGVLEGENFDYSLVEKAIGIKRTLDGAGASEGWEYFYFCDRTKGANKKKCGKWVDEKGNKVKIGSNVTLKGNSAIISIVSEKESGRYVAILENPKDESYGLVLYVGATPPPPPPPTN